MPKLAEKISPLRMAWPAATSWTMRVAGSRSPRWVMPAVMLKPFAEDQGFPFFVTRLTPYQSMGMVDSENPVTLRGSYQDEIYLSAEVSLEQFQDPSLVVGLAVIDPYSVSPSSGSLS